MSTFFDDLKSVRPTNLMLIPRISNMCARQPSAPVLRAERPMALAQSWQGLQCSDQCTICRSDACRLYDGFQAQLEKVQRTDPGKDPASLKQVRHTLRGGCMAAGGAAAAACMHSTSAHPGACMQELVEHFREGDCGGRVLTALTASAPTAPEVVDFLRDALLVPIYEAYGSTGVRGASGSDGGTSVGSLLHAMPCHACGWVGPLLGRRAGFGTQRRAHMLTDGCCGAQRLAS